MLLAIILGGSGGLGAVLAKGVASRGAASIFFYLIFFVDPSGSGWHKQIKAGCNNHANNQERKEH